MGRDRIRLNDIVVFAHLGVTEAEREVGQRIHLDLDLELDLSGPAGSDALLDTVNYEAVYKRVVEIVERSRHKLLEALAGDLAREILAGFPVDGLRIRIRKPNVPFSGSLASAEVELVRSR